MSSRAEDAPDEQAELFGASLNAGDPKAFLRAIDVLLDEGCDLTSEAVTFLEEKYRRAIFFPNTTAFSLRH
jgi:hypothetical protein